MEKVYQEDIDFMLYCTKTKLKNNKEIIDISNIQNIILEILNYYEKENGKKVFWYLFSSYLIKNKQSTYNIFEKWLGRPIMNRAKTSKGIFKFFQFYIEDNNETKVEKKDENEEKKTIDEYINLLNEMKDLDISLESLNLEDYEVYDYYNHNLKTKMKNNNSYLKENFNFQKNEKNLKFFDFAKNDLDMKDSISIINYVFEELKNKELSLIYFDFSENEKIELNDFDKQLDILLEINKFIDKDKLYISISNKNIFKENEIFDFYKNKNINLIFQNYNSLDKIENEELLKIHKKFYKIQNEIRKKSLFDIPNLNSSLRDFIEYSINSSNIFKIGEHFESYRDYKIAFKWYLYSYEKTKDINSLKKLISFYKEGKAIDQNIKKYQDYEIELKKEEMEENDE
jgi:hypothetical protein